MYVDLCWGKAGIPSANDHPCHPVSSQMETLFESVHSTQTSGPKHTLLVPTQPENPLSPPHQTPPSQRGQSLAFSTEKESSHMKTSCPVKGGPLRVPGLSVFLRWVGGLRAERWICWALGWFLCMLNIHTDLTYPHTYSIQQLT